MSAHVPGVQFAEMMGAVQKSIEALIAIRPYAFTNDEGEIEIFPSVDSICEGLRLREKICREMVQELL